MLEKESAHVANNLLAPAAFLAKLEDTDEGIRGKGEKEPSLGPLLDVEALVVALHNWELARSDGTCALLVRFLEGRLADAEISERDDATCCLILRLGTMVANNV